MRNRISTIINKMNAYQSADNKYAQLETKLYQREIVFILLYAPDYPNIGDAAIAMAEHDFLNDYFNGCFVQEIPFKELSVGRLELIPIARRLKKYPLLITGGGFLGTIWLDAAERPIRRLLSVLDRKTPILFFPQTMFYENDAVGNNELKKASKLYRKHTRIALCMREEVSFSLASENFKSVYMFPDMVLYPNAKWNYTKEIYRYGAAVCLRDDIEKTMGKKDRKYIDSMIVSRFEGNVRNIDMLYQSDVHIEERKKIVENQMNLFRGSEIAITDRLHGMLFAAITETPCVVISSKSYKIKGCFEWIKHLGYIKLIENVSEFANACEEVLSVENRKYDMSLYQKYFDDLASLISRMFMINPYD